jgi:putative ABC transport system permease protein
MRAVLTTFAIFIGVTLIAGAFINTDTINSSFDEIFEESVKGTDVVITAEVPVEEDTSGPPPFSAALLPRVERVDGVEEAVGSINTQGKLFSIDDEELGAGFAPNFIFSVVPDRFNPITYPKGRAARTDSEVALDQQTADRKGVEIGERIKVSGERATGIFRVVGLTKLGDASFGGAATAELTLPAARRVTGEAGQFDQINVAADSGVSPEELRDRIARVLPNTVRVETGEENADRQSDEIREDLQFLPIVLMVFAGVSLLVAAFLIFNTFSITVAQRIREFGMLRTLGASRGQVLASVMAEALTLGVAGSVLGLFGGIGAAKGITALFREIGVDLPSRGTVIEPRTVIVSLIVGLGVTFVAALSPALRATRISPMAALREAALPGGHRRGRVLAGFAVLLMLAGLGLTLLGLFGGAEGGGAAGLMGGGAFMVILGVSIFSSNLVRPLAAVAGWPLEKLRGLAGRLARENALRNPGRTAVTAAALMIGLALVTFVTVFAAGFKASIANALDTTFKSDLVVQNIDSFSPIPNGAAAVAGRVDGVRMVSTFRYSQAKVQNRGASDVRVAGVDPRTIGEVTNIEYKDGASEELVRGLQDNQVLVDQAHADSDDIEKGDRLSLLTPAGNRTAVTVVGEYKDKAGLVGQLMGTQRLLATEFAERQDTYDLIELAPGADLRQVQKRINAQLDRTFPIAEALDQEEVKDEQESGVNDLLGLFYALLLLSVIVSLFGIVNTLALSIHERTRELGMLRAIGMSRRQVRRIVRYESVITALIGAILGLILGMVFAALIAQPLVDEGFELSYPVGTLLLLLIAAALAGVLAAIGPARRAAKLDVLEAVAYE